MIDDATIEKIASECGVVLFVTDTKSRYAARKFARAIEQLARQEQREEDARICESDYRRMKDTEEAHYRHSKEPFIAEQFGFNRLELRRFKELAEAIRASGKENSNE